MQHEIWSKCNLLVQQLIRSDFLVDSMNVIFYATFEALQPRKKIWIFIILICQIITNVWIASIKNLCRAKIKDEFWKMHLHSREENHGAVCKENFNSRVIFTCRTICINWKLWNVNSIKMRIFFVCLSRLYVFCLLISECKKFEQGVDLPWHLCLRSWNFQQKKNFFRMSKNSSVLWVRSQFA